MIDFESEIMSQSMPIARIKVLGVGGGGSNMVNSMIDAGYENVEFMVANTDAQALKLSNAPHKIQLGIKSTRGLGAGANPDVGRMAAEEDLSTLVRVLKDADVVFLVGGLGGGTGSGALPVIARALKEKDILTVAVVTKPFMIEGMRRMKVAQKALDELVKEVDTLIVIPNQRLLDKEDKAKRKVTLLEAFKEINNVLNQFIRAIADIISKPGHINVDFADLKTVMKRKGFAIIGTGRASGEDRAREAAMQAISSPLLDKMSVTGAQGVVLNISGSSDLGLHEMSEAASVVYEQVHEDATIILGSVIDESLRDEVTVTVIATGFPQTNSEPAVEIAARVAERHTVSVATKAPDPINIVPAQENSTIDLNNLDIPAIMRRMMQEKQR